MARRTKKQTVRTLLEELGTTFSKEAGFTVKDTPSPLFRLLTLSILMSARIRSDIAVGAARALAKQGWTTAQKMSDATWRERTDTLNRAGYGRYDERTSTMLGETADMVLERYRGDLRHLREEAGRDPEVERRLLKRFKGIGDVGASIFLREVQVVWDEVAPFADERVLEVARSIDLAREARDLRRLAGADDFPRLVAALMRVRLEGEPKKVVDELMRAA